MSARVRNALIALAVLLAGLAVMWFLRSHQRVCQPATLPAYGEPTFNPLFALREALRRDGVDAETRRTLDLAGMQLQPRDTVLLLDDPRQLTPAQVEQAGLPGEGLPVLRDPHDVPRTLAEAARAEHVDLRGVTEQFEDLATQPAGDRTEVHLGFDHDTTTHDVQATGETQESGHLGLAAAGAGHREPAQLVLDLRCHCHETISLRLLSRVSAAPDAAGRFVARTSASLAGSCRWVPVSATSA